MHSLFWVSAVILHICGGYSPNLTELSTFIMFCHKCSPNGNNRSRVGIYAFLEHLDHLDLGMACSLDHLDHLDCGPLAFSIISIISNMASNIVWSFRGLKQHVLQSLCQSVPILGLQHIICSYLCKIGVLRLCRAQFCTKRLPTHRVC